VLLAGLIEAGRRTPAAEALLDAVGTPGLPRPLTAFHCCLEFYSVATRLPGRLRVPPELALAALDERILQKFDVRQIPADSMQELFVQAVAHRIDGGRIYDHHVATIARSCAAEIVVTENRRHFTSLLDEGVDVLGSAELAERLSLDSR